MAQTAPTPPSAALQAHWHTPHLHPGVQQSRKKALHRAGKPKSLLGRSVCTEKPPLSPSGGWRSHCSGFQHIPNLPRHAHLALGVQQRLLGVQTGVCHLDDVLQLPGLLLHLGCQEKCCWHHRLQRENALFCFEKPRNSRFKRVNRVGFSIILQGAEGVRVQPAPGERKGSLPLPKALPREQQGWIWGGSRSPPSTYVPVELGEGLHHVEAMHVHDGRVDGELGAAQGVKEKHRQTPRAATGTDPRGTRRARGSPGTQDSPSPNPGRALPAPKIKSPQSPTGSALPAPRIVLPDSPAQLSLLPKAFFWDLLGPKNQAGLSRALPSFHSGPSTALPAPRNFLTPNPGLGSPETTAQLSLHPETGFPPSRNELGSPRVPAPPSPLPKSPRSPKKRARLTRDVPAAPSRALRHRSAFPEPFQHLGTASPAPETAISRTKNRAGLPPLPEPARALPTPPSPCSKGRLLLHPQHPRLSPHPLPPLSARPAPHSHPRPSAA